MQRGLAAIAELLVLIIRYCYCVVTAHRLYIVSVATRGPIIKLDSSS